MRRSRIMMMAACFALAGCGGGGGGSNDNGVSFRFFGVFQETREQVAPAADILPTVDLAIPDTQAFVVLGKDTTIPTDRNGDGDLDGGFLGVENNLDQSVNVQSVKVEIFIPGSVLANPVATDLVPLSFSLPPATVDDKGVRTPSKEFAQTVLVQPSVLAFLADNQTLLPLLPFNMTLVMTITAISDSGDSFVTNEVNYLVNVRAPSL
jgi:hypothetical protein